MFEIMNVNCNYPYMFQLPVFLSGALDLRLLPATASTSAPGVASFV